MEKLLATTAIIISLILHIIINNIFRDRRLVQIYPHLHLILRAASFLQEPITNFLNVRNGYRKATYLTTNFTIWHLNLTINYLTSTSSNSNQSQRPGGLWLDLKRIATSPTVSINNTVTLSFTPVVDPLVVDPLVVSVCLYFNTIAHVS